MCPGANRKQRQSKTRSFFAQCIWLALGLFFVSISNAERLPIKTYTVADGLLRDNVYKIKQDSRGFLWFGTSEGVSRFDGYGFVNFTTEDGLPERRVNDFLETKDGTIYLATNSGLARLNPTAGYGSQPNASIQSKPLFTVLLPGNPRTKKINVLFEDENGAVFAGTEDGLYKLNDRDEFEKIDLGALPPNSDALWVSSIIKDRRGAMWIGTESGLYRLSPDGTVEHFTQENGLPDINISVVREDRNGRIWIGLRPRMVAGLVLLAAETKKNQSIVERHYRITEGLPADWITDLYETSDGVFWVATTRGLCRWQGGENSVCKTYTDANDLCDTEIFTVAEDKDKNLWTGTRCGLKKWTRHGFTAYNDPNGTVSKAVNSIFENAAGELFVSYNDGDIRTVSRFDGEQFELVKPNFPSSISYFGWGSRQTVWQDPAGDWWFPTGVGLYRFPQAARFEDLTKIRAQKIQSELKNKEVFRFYEDSRGDFWIATTGATNELWRWERAADVWHDYTSAAGFDKNRIGTAFVEDRNGNLWIAASSNADATALFRFRDNRFQIFTRKENELLAGWLHNLFFDDKNRLWITSTGSGLLRLDDAAADQLNFVRYTPAEGLSSIAVSCVTADEFGKIYIGTGRGLDRLTPETGQIENFTTADGLPNSFVEICYRDRKNNLWFGTSNGLARFIPEMERRREPPNIFITGLRVSGVPQAVSVLGETTIQTLVLAADQQQVTIDFLGLGTNLGERLKYEYRFSNADWTETGERTVNFANLASGNYQFEVRAQTADRIYSQPATVSFKIAAPLWQQWWFIAFVLLLTTLAIYLFYKNRLARLLEMERMRTRIATDLHDDIGANLTRISLLSEVAKQKSANGSGSLLTSIADIARESVASMNDIVWAISPDHDSLLDLTRRMRRHAEDVFEFREIELDFNAPASNFKLSVGARRDVLLIFKESVNNAAKHSDCSQVTIDFRCENSVLRLSIEDNGKGFDSAENHEGQGLRSIKRRAAALGGNLTISSRNDGGTHIAFEMSLLKASQV